MLESLLKEHEERMLRMLEQLLNPPIRATALEISTQLNRRANQTEEMLTDVLMMLQPTAETQLNRPQVQPIQPPPFARSGPSALQSRRT